MTTAEKLQAITADIREKLPKMMRYEEGCIIKDAFDKEKFKIVKDFGYALGLLSLESDIVIKVSKGDFSINEIVGKEPMLNDVLEWGYIVSGLARKSKELQVSFDGYFCVYDYAWGKTEMCRVSWNLSKPYLKDQSEEVIDFLYNILSKAKYE